MLNAYRGPRPAGLRQGRAGSAVQARRERGRGLCRAGEAGRQGRSAEGSRARRQAAGLSAGVLQDPKVWEEFKALKPDLQVMAFVTLFVPEEFLNIPTHGSIQYHPSLLPAYRGAIGDQLADHQGREGNRAVDLLARQRPRYRRRAAAEEDADLRHRHARHRLFRPPVPDGRRGHAGVGRPGQGRQGAAHQAGRSRRPPTKAAAAPTTPRSTGASPGSRSTG